MTHPKLEKLYSVAPSLPADLFDSQSLSEPLSTVLSHANIQVLAMACKQLRPDLADEAFHEFATPRDVLSWLEQATGDAKLDERFDPTDYSTKRVTIRPLVESDLPVLYQAAVQPEGAHRWRFRGRTPSPEEFRQALFSSDLLFHFVVAQSVPQETAIGYIAAYGADSWSGYCYMALQRVARPEDDAPSSGVVMEGFLSGIRYAFDHFPLRKIYFEVPEYNLSLFGDVEIVKSEGVLKEHQFYADKWWDVHVLAIWRSDWTSASKSFMKPWTLIGESTNLPDIPP
ncbi:MAG: GNAT family protein [Acidimicrobiales bacterium]